MDAVRAAGARRDSTVGERQRKKRGVVHTPFELARFMARRVADVEGTLVDPACGPGIFLVACMREHAAGRRALGFDIDGSALEQAAEILEPMAQARGWSLSLSRGNTLAAPVVARGPVVVIGNPPWAGRSANRAAGYTDALLDDFKRDADGAPLRERKVGVLSDDYVRFVRWACEQIRRPEGGALAVVTNASFLDGPVHRGMRACLMRWFAEIEIIDLGGSALIARRGDRDENVFGVRPGVAITIARRPADHDETRWATVAYVAMRGSRAEKLQRLTSFDEPAISLDPRSPHVRLVPTPEVDPDYAGWPSLPELMPFHREGLQTNRDAFCVDVDRATLMERLEAFARGEARSWPGKAGVESPHYDPALARDALREVIQAGGDVARRLAYRPLEDRWVCTVRPICHRARPALLRAIGYSEGALLTVRKDRGERPWAHFGFSEHPPDNCYLSSRSSCRTRAFPTHGPDGAPNLDREAVTAWAGFEVSSTDLSRYALCVLASPSYRDRFDAALRSDYPRIPPPSRASFDACVEAGAALARAFSDTESGAREVVVGHRSLRSRSLHGAIARCGAAVALGRLLPERH